MAGSTHLVFRRFGPRHCAGPSMRRPNTQRQAILLDTLAMRASPAWPTEEKGEWDIKEGEECHGHSMRLSQGISRPANRTGGLTEPSGRTYRPQKR